MRFGAALDLWHKGNLHASHDDDAGNDASEREAPVETIGSEAAIKLEERIKEVGADRAALLQYFKVESLPQMTAPQAKAAYAMLDKKAKAAAKEQEAA